MNIGNIIDGKYTIIEEIGFGGMGKVFKVQALNNEFFALKVCLSIEEENIKRFQRETRLMASVIHENVIEVLDINLDCNNPYFIMPLCKFSIDKKINILQEKHELTIKLILNICSGINALHLSGIIHRDIKPKNILIDKNNVVKVSDLGLGKFIVRESTILTSSSVYMGTDGFIPPEFYKIGGTKNATVRSDIYQLGKTIYNIFTNDNPILIEVDRLPPGLIYIVKKCTENNVEDRYKSIAELENSLNNYLLSLQPLSNPANVFENYINIAKDNLKNGTYEKENIENIISVLYTFKEFPELFFKKFNEIPLKLLGITASNINSATKQLIDIYNKTIEKYFVDSQINFSDAEYVSNAMEKIFKQTKDFEIKIKTMRITLVTSVICNRYNAMDVFDQMLQEIQDSQEAIATNEMLRDNMEYYKQIAYRIPSNKLHPIIQKLQEEVHINLELEQKSNSEQTFEW